MTVDPETIAVYDARARDYADMFDTENSGRHLRAFRETLPDGARVLDLGCGPGNTAAILKPLTSKTSTPSPRAKYSFSIEAPNCARWILS